MPGKWDCIYVVLLSRGLYHNISSHSRMYTLTAVSTLLGGADDGTGNSLPSGLSETPSCTVTPCKWLHLQHASALSIKPHNGPVSSADSVPVTACVIKQVDSR